MLLLGTKTNDPQKLIEIDHAGMLHHTLVVGQSGSGKSFMVARLIEEILLRSRARVLIIDPNGDFRQISKANQAIWDSQGENLARLDAACRKEGWESYDTSPTFTQGWQKRRFVHLVPGIPLAKAAGLSHTHKLLVHWDALDDEQRQFLFNANVATEPNVFLGLMAVAENAKWVSDRPNARTGNDLRGMIAVAQQFIDNNISMRQYEYAKSLDRNDWFAVLAKIHDLLSKYTLWSSMSGDAPHRRPPGLADFIDGPFLGAAGMETYWDSLVLSLDSARQGDALLAADVALSRLWLQAKNVWRERAEQSESARKDPIVPTFVVVDEAHNFAPEHSRDPITDRVTRRLLQIASEGRKYGLYLILATQRPTKLHRELVPECENACVLRLQSKLETSFSSDVLGLSDAAHAVPKFTQGQGVLLGRWVGGLGEIDTKFASARIVVGGGGIDGSWEETPSATPPLVQQDSVGPYVQDLLSQTDSPIQLARLASLVRNQFGDLAEQWFGLGTFRQFLDDLGVDGLRTSSIPPGYAYLEGAHQLPEEIPDVSGWSNLDSSGRELFEYIRLYFEIPVMTKSDMKTLIESISEEVQTNRFNLVDTSKAVRDRCVAAGARVSRHEVNFFIKSAYLAGHRLDSDMPQDAVVIASAIVRSILNGLKIKGATPSPPMEAKISELLSGGLVVQTPQPDA
jgi:hypothetical protein